LFIAPRGFGKTHLLSLIEDEIRENSDLSKAYHVVRFPEEANRLLSFSDFLLGVCENLKDTLPDEAEWASLFAQLATEEKDEIIVDTLVPALRKRRKSTKQALVVMLENINQIFDEQLKDNQAVAAIRGFFMEDNGCLLIATSPTQFDGILDNKRPFYDFFDVQMLDQLSEEETIELVRKNLELDENPLLKQFDSLRHKLIALYRMTGGSPRLTMMLYELIAHDAVLEVKAQLHTLLDRITPFYQDRLRDLSPQERAVLETVAAMRNVPKTPGNIALRMRMKPTQVSSLLARLQKAHYLRSIESPTDKRSRLYVIREGFFDIWLAMNISRGERQRLPFLVDFFEQFYPLLEDRQKIREKYHQALVQPGNEFSNSSEVLDLLSEVGSADEKAVAKTKLAVLYAKEGATERADKYFREAKALPINPIGQWILNRPGRFENTNYLDEIQEIIACWESHREGNLELFVGKLREMGGKLNSRNWSDIKIQFLSEHLAMVEDVRERISLRLSLGDLFFNIAKWNSAEHQLKSALEEAERGNDQKVEMCSLVMNNLAQLYKSMNRLVEAEPLMKRALEIDEKSYGEEHPEVAIRLNNLAQLYQATNRLVEAEPLMNRALAIDEKTYGEEHPSVARDLSNLAMLYKETNRLIEAESLMNRALAIAKRNYGEEHPRVATQLINLASLYKATNRLVEAEPLIKRALEIDEENYGEEHPDVAIDLSHLAQLYQATNRLVEAEPLIKRALAIDEKSYGEEHPSVAIDLNNLAQLYRATNRLVEAEPLMNRALVIFKRSFAENHPNVKIVLSNLISILKELGLNDRAAKLLKELE
jgi:DNA-binding MarR family transcriptional regulator/2-hydroxy-3-keto-5-methylthiopentenyl-1-phosphate phosphatase